MKQWLYYKKWSNFLRKKQIVRNEAKKWSLGISHGNNRSFEGRKKMEAVLIFWKWYWKVVVLLLLGACVWFELVCTSNKWLSGRGEQLGGFKTDREEKWRKKERKLWIVVGVRQNDLPNNSACRWKLLSLINWRFSSIENTFIKCFFFICTNYN